MIVIHKLLKCSFPHLSKSEILGRATPPHPPNFVALYPNLPKLFLAFRLNLPTPCLPAHSFKINYSLTQQQVLCPFRIKQSFPAISLLLPAPPSKGIFPVLSRFCTKRPTTKRSWRNGAAMNTYTVLCFPTSPVYQNTLTITFYYLCPVGRTRLVRFGHQMDTYSET